jgi:hypothetical protein
MVLSLAATYPLQLINFKLGREIEQKVPSLLEARCDLGLQTKQ